MMTAVGAAAFALSRFVLQQTPAAPPAAITAPPPPMLSTSGSATIASGTPVTIEIVDAITSKIAKPGDTFHIRLAQPLIVAGRIAIPAGTTGSGVVIHAAKARAGGKPGELILAARTLNLGNVSVPLRGLHLGGTGADHGDLALAMNIAASPIGVLVSGGEKKVPGGTLGIAKIAADTALAVAAPPVTGVSTTTQDTSS